MVPVEVYETVAIEHFQVTDYVSKKVGGILIGRDRVDGRGQIQSLLSHIGFRCFIPAKPHLSIGDHPLQ
jgi:hypothetical protein